MTAKIKLNASSGGGSVSLEAPTSTTGNANVEFKLPIADGTSGQALTTNASGQLAFASVAVGGASNISFNSGNGIDFSATSDATGKSSEILDDYEEGTWTPAAEGTYVSGTPTYHSRNGLYTKIGRMVYIQGRIHFNSISYSNTNQIFELTGLPFNGATAGGGTPGVVGATVWSQLEWVGASQSSYGTNNDVVLSPTVSGSNKIRFFTCSQDKYYLSELKNAAVDGNAAMFQFAFYYTT